MLVFVSLMLDVVAVNPQNQPSTPAAVPMVTPPKPAAHQYGLGSAMDYPTEAFWKHQEGKAVMTVHVTAKGIVDSCSIKTSSGSDSLDQASCNVARHIKYDPAHDQNEQPVDAITSFQMSWVLPR